MDLGETRALARMFVQVAEQARLDFANAVRDYGLPVPLTRALLVIDGPTSMRDIAAELGCDPSYVTGLADQLEERSLGTRTIGRDRRVKMLELTAAGKAMKNSLSEAIARDASFGHQLSAAQKSQLKELLLLLLPSEDPSGD